MRKNEIFYTFKFPSSYLKKEKYNVHISFDEAFQKGMVVSLGDSMLLRVIRSLTGKSVDYEEVENLIAYRKKLKQVSSSKRNAEKIRVISDKIATLLFVPEYISVYVENLSHYAKINETNPLTVNNVKYKRLLCSAGGARNNVATFVPNELYDAIDKIISNGMKNIPLSPAKFNAYYALCSSASIPVPDLKFGVIPDYIQNSEEEVEYIQNSNEEFIDDIPTHTTMVVKNNIFDGMGIITPEGAQIWADSLELDYLPSAFCVRNAFLKGMVCVFDIKNFVKVHSSGNPAPLDVWGNPIDLNDIDLLITESQLKLWNAYDNMRHYIEECHKNGFNFCITRVTPKKEKNTTCLNYQFIQATHQDQLSIEKLCSPTVEFFENLLYSDSNYLRVYCLNNAPPTLTKEFFNTLSPQSKAILLSDTFINDPAIKSWLLKSINKKIRESYIGVLLVHGNYQVAISDPYALMEHTMGLEVKGILKRDQHYMSYWNRQPEYPKQVAAMRAPLTWRSEVNILNLQDNEEVKYWYKYLDSGVVYNIWGVDCMLQADSD